MTEAEMLLWLFEQGDAPAAWSTPSFGQRELRTKNGQRFVRSREGIVMAGDRWETRYSWSRV